MNPIPNIQTVLLFWVKILTPLCKPIIILVLSCNVIYAQSTTVDSLRTALLNTSTDLGRLALMNELSTEMIESDSEQSLIYAHKALSLSRQIKASDKEAMAMFNLGMLLFGTSKIDSSLIYFKASEHLAEKLNLRQLQTDNLMRIANWYLYHRADSTKTVDYLLKSIAVSKAAKYNYGTGRAYAKLASFYTRYKRIDLCEEYLRLSAKYYLKSGRKRTIAHYYNEVGNKIWDYNPKKSMDFYFEGLKFFDSHPNLKISLAKAYSTIGEPEIALKYLTKAITHLDSIQKERSLGLALAQLAEVHMQLGNHKAALKTCQQTISLLEPLSLSLQSALPSIYRTKGQLMELKGNDKSALEFYTKSLDKANEINQVFEPVKMIFKTVKSNLVLGNFYLDKDLAKSEKHCKIALENAKKNNYTTLEIEACECLYNIFKGENSYSDALKYFERKEALNDSLSTLKVEHALEVAKKDKQLAEEIYKKNRKDEQIKNQKRLNTTLGLSSLIGFLLIAFLIRSRRRVRKQNTEIVRKTHELENANLNLARSNEDLERFAYITSHDLKSPLNMMISFNGLISKALKKEENPQVFQYINFIETSGKRMVQLIEDILEYSKLSNKHSSENELEVINLNDLIKEISQLIVKNPEGKSVSIETNHLPTLRWNHSKIFLLFKNLIENGLKYNESEHPTIKLNFTNSKGINSISIEDNGIGINKEYFDKIFVIFQRLHGQSKYEGTGLGLATCKKIVEEFKGEISLSSEEGKGTIFNIQLPSNLITTVEETNRTV